MFTIELVVTHPARKTEVVETSTSNRHLLYDVDHRAKILLREARRRFPDNPPNGYRILNETGLLLSRSRIITPGGPVSEIGMPWGEPRNATIVPLEAEPEVVCLGEDDSARAHRMVSPDHVPATPDEECTAHVAARPAGRDRLKIELVGRQRTEVAHAIYDLAERRVLEQSGQARITPIDGEWALCELAMTPRASGIALLLTLMDQSGRAAYAGSPGTGVHLRPIMLSQRRTGQAPADEDDPS